MNKEILKSQPVIDWLMYPASKKDVHCCVPSENTTNWNTDYKFLESMRGTFDKPIYISEKFQDAIFSIKENTFRNILPDTLSSLNGSKGIVVNFRYKLENDKPYWDFRKGCMNPETYKMRKDASSSVVWCVNNSIFTLYLFVTTCEYSQCQYRLDFSYDKNGDYVDELHNYSKEAALNNSGGKIGLKIRMINTAREIRQSYINEGKSIPDSCTESKIVECLEAMYNIENDVKCLGMQLLSCLALIEYAKVEVKDLKHGKKIVHNGTEYTSTSNVPFEIFDSRWFTEICSDKDFSVRGHFRLQPKKVNGEWTKELIYINEFMKHGYHRKALIDKVKEEQIA